METMVKVARLRNSPYVINFRLDGGVKRYEWAGSKGDRIDVRPVPQDVVNHLLMSSRCFSDGELKIIEDTEEAKELVQNIDNIEQYQDNTHSREEIIAILEGNINSMKKELNKITMPLEKTFIVDVAKEIDLDSSAKRAFISQWMGVPQDILFSEEAE